VTAAFDAFLHAMGIAVICFAAVSVALAVLVVVLRGSTAAALHHSAALQQRWQNLFRTAFATPATEFPPIAKNDRLGVLMVFNTVRQLRQTDRDTDAKGRTAYGAAFDGMARTLGLDAYARSLMDHSDDPDKIAALGALGFLGDSRLLPAVRNHMRTGRASLSRAAAEALVRLDPASIDEVVVQVRDRFGYVRSRIELLFREVGTQRLDPAMQEVIFVSDDRGKLRLIDYLGCCSQDNVRAICRDVLKQTKNPEVIAAALKALAPVAVPDDAALGRTFVEDERPFVRLSASRVLKETATIADAPLLERLTRDANWWVRRRAAETLVAIDTGNVLATQVLERQDDPYARAAVTVAMADRRAGYDGVRLPERRSEKGDQSRDDT
jgi:HEAT repeat protein